MEQSCQSTTDGEWLNGDIVDGLCTQNVHRGKVQIKNEQDESQTFVNALILMELTFLEMNNF